MSFTWNDEVKYKHRAINKDPEISNKYWIMPAESPASSTASLTRR